MLQLLSQCACHLRLTAKEIRVEYEIRANSVTIVERRPPWRPELGSEWSRVTVAQLRYEDREWTLYWSEHSERWHPFEDLDPTSDLPAVLREIDGDPAGIFWG